MLSTFRPESFSPRRRAVYIVSAHLVFSYGHLVLSYILFDVFDPDGFVSAHLVFSYGHLVLSCILFGVPDLDGSNLRRFFAAPELFDFSGQRSPWHSNLISSGDEAVPQPAPSSPPTPLSSARAHGYKVSLARNSLSDSSPYG